MGNSAALRLSAVCAFLWRIHPTFRLVKIGMQNGEITVDVVVDQEPSELAREDISDAATEIIADFPDATRIVEHITVSNEPLPKEGFITNGWIYCRAE